MTANASSRMKIMADNARKYGVDINYTPEVVVDTTTITNAEWKETMKNGLGSSTAGIVMGVSNFGDTPCLVLNKQGRLPEAKVSCDKQFTFDCGHAMEQPLLKYFEAKTGFKVFLDRNRYRHPLYPFMFTDLDALCIDSDGMRCVIECKMTSSILIKEWHSGVYGVDAVVAVMGYVWQATHHLSVMNLDRCYLLIGVDNNPANIRIIRIDRDFSSEKALLTSSSLIWNDFVKTGNVPELVRISNASFQQQKHMYPAKMSIKEFEFTQDMEDVLKKYFALEQKENELKEKCVPYREQKNALKLKILQAMHGNDSASLTTRDHAVKYSVSFRRAAPKEKVDINQLKLLHPELIDLFKKEKIISESEEEPVFRIRERELK